MRNIAYNIMLCIEYCITYYDVQVRELSVLSNCYPPFDLRSRVIKLYLVVY